MTRIPASPRQALDDAIPPKFVPGAAAIVNAGMIIATERVVVLGFITEPRLADEIGRYRIRFLRDGYETIACETSLKAIDPD